MSDPSTPLGTGQAAVSRFLEFTRAEWAQLRAATPLPLTEPQLRRLVIVNERMSLDEVEDIYLPLSRLLNLYVGATVCYVLGVCWRKRRGVPDSSGVTDQRVRYA